MKNTTHPIHFFKRGLCPLLACTALVLICSCAGYRLGNIQGGEMEGVKGIYVPVAKNYSTEPGLPVVVTNAVIRRLQNDGTFRSVRSGEADATLEIKITKVHQTPLRGSLDDFEKTLEYDVDITATASLINHRTGRTVFKDLPFNGKTSYFVQSQAGTPAVRMQESQRQSMPLAAEDLARVIVNRVTEGW